MAQNILRIDSSSATATSVTRQLSFELIEKIGGGANVVVRDLTEAPATLSEGWLGAAYTPAEARSDEQKDLLALSDALVGELQAADTIVIGAPIYNFSVPAALKLWIDQVARVGVTFNYTENGPKGLLEGKKAYIVAASGGVPIGSPVDFAVPFLKQFLNFIGITDIEVVGAEGVAVDRDAAIAKGQAAIDAIEVQAVAA